MVMSREYRTLWEYAIQFVVNLTQITALQALKKTYHVVPKFNS
jgi:hypothetical protein